MAMVLIKNVLNNYFGRTLTGIYFSWSIYIAMFLIKGTCFLIPKGGSP